MDDEELTLKSGRLLTTKVFERTKTLRPALREREREEKREKKEGLGVSSRVPISRKS